MIKILVTGGLGYIGSHTVVELINFGYEPVIVDDLSNSYAFILNQIEQITGKRPRFYKLDLTEESDVRKLYIAEPHLAGIIHFAAFKAVGESITSPLKYYRNNFYSLINLLNAYYGKKMSFIFSSSCTIYGEPDIMPVTEEATIKPAESPYGNTKQIAEEILKDMVDSGGSQYKVISLRYFNPAGAHATGLIGELPLGVPQNLVPFVAQSASGKRGKLTVYGDDYDTPDGSCIRDYIHVVDLAKAHVSALKYAESDKFAGYDVFNIGTGKGTSVLEIISAFEGITKIKVNFSIGKRRPGDIVQIWGDVAKAAEKLHWRAELGVDNMMLSAWKWEEYSSTLMTTSI